MLSGILTRQKIIGNYKCESDYQKMKFKYIMIIGSVLSILSCGYGKGGKTSEPYDGGHGIGIDTETVNRIQQNEDSIHAVRSVNISHRSASSSSESDNMRGFDPASEDDMEDNGMSRYMENYDDEGWD